MPLAVITGLAVGIAFIVVFSLIFSTFNPIIQRKFQMDVSIVGLKDTYRDGEKIDFSVRVKGYGMNCGAPALKIVDANNPGIVIDPVTLIGDYSCDPTAYDFDRTWTLQDMGVIHNIMLESGHYKMVVGYGETLEKEFEVISNTVNCQESTLCSYSVRVGNSTYPINFRMNGTVENMTADLQINTLTIELKAESTTSLQIAVPREVVDARTGADGISGADDDLVVFADQIPADDVKEFSTKEGTWARDLGISDNPEKYRILEIHIEQGTETVEIVGTWLI